MESTPYYSTLRTCGRDVRGRARCRVGGLASETDRAACGAARIGNAMRPPRIDATDMNQRGGRLRDSPVGSRTSLTARRAGTWRNCSAASTEHLSEAHVRMIATKHQRRERRPIQ